MATLETKQFVFEPDMNLIREQCDRVVQRAPSLAKKITASLNSFETARGYVDNGDVGKAFEKLSESIRDILDSGADELEASCFFYIGFLALAIGDDEFGIRMLHGSLHKTQNPWLALCTYNRLMIHHLTKENYDAVVSIANASKKVVSGLPRSTASVYFGSGASYSKAEAHFRQGEYSEVFPHIQSALEGFRDISMMAEVAKCQGLLGNALISIGEVEGGLEYTEKSLEMFHEMENEDEMPFLLQGRGLAMLRTGNKAEAIRDLREALKLFKRRGEVEVKGINSTLAILSKLET